MRPVAAPDPWATQNPLSPKKLSLTKWTAVKPRNRERHLVVTRVIEPEPPSMRVEHVELEAAFLANPNRFKNRSPKLPPIPTAVWINPTPEETQSPSEPVA